MFRTACFVGDVEIFPMETERLLLRPWRMQDAADFHKLRLESYQHLQPFEPRWGPEAKQGQDFPSRWQRWQEAAKQGRGLGLGIFHRSSRHLLGGIQLNEIIRGALQLSTLSYWCGFRYKDKGIISEALPAVVALCFQQLELHRLEAYCLPENLASQRVLIKSGFQAEGLAERYLRINGQWQDHWRYYRLNES